VVNGADRMSSYGPNERTMYPLEAQTFYVAEQPGSDRVAVNRLISADGADHADATGTMPDYTLDQLLGCAWSAASFPGLVPLLEASNSASGDYAMVFPAEMLPGYISQPLAAYGYPRYGSAGEVLLSLSAGGITVQSNAVAGGATWRWFWNGTQFVNNFAYGRQIQADFYYPTSPDYNPTEAGDSLPRDIPALGHGSPLIRFENQGMTQITRAVPLNWMPATFGGDADRPVIWNQMVIGKEVTLNFNNLGPVARYTTHLVLPTATRGTFEAPNLSLRSNFNRFWIYDAPSRSLQEITSQVPLGCNFAGSFIYTPNFGGAVVSDASGTFALGVYGADDRNGGSVNYFNIGNYVCAGDGPGESATDTVVIAAVKGGFGGNDNNFVFPSGESMYNVYIVNGTVQGVAALMDKLYALGAR
jgi:hypothetical protein